MAKTSKETIFQDEMKVLNALQDYSKDNINKIAKICGFSSQKVWRIIRNLEKNKIIWGYTPITDGHARNLKHFLLLVKRSTKSFNESFKKELIFEKLDDYHPGFVKIEDIYLTYGNFDGVVTFCAPNIIAAKQFVKNLNQKIGYYFDDYLILETLFPLRKQGLKNPQIKNLVEYL